MEVTSLHLPRDTELICGPKYIYENSRNKVRIFSTPGSPFLSWHSSAWFTVSLLRTWSSFCEVCLRDWFLLASCPEAAESKSGEEWLAAALQCHSGEHHSSGHRRSPKCDLSHESVWEVSKELLSLLPVWGRWHGAGKIWSLRATKAKGEWVILLL